MAHVFVGGADIHADVRDVSMLELSRRGHCSSGQLYTRALDRKSERAAVYTSGLAREPYIILTTTSKWVCIIYSRRLCVLHVAFSPMRMHVTAAQSAKHAVLKYARAVFQTVDLPAQ